MADSEKVDEEAKRLLVNDFKLFLLRKKLSEVSIEHYTIYYKRFLWLMNESDKDLSQELINAFLDIYPHCLSRAFLKNYLEYMDITHLKIPKITGRKVYKEVVVPSESEVLKIRDELYNMDFRYGLLFDVTIKCALRRTEAISIRVRDITIETMNRTPVMFILLKKTKGNKERKVVVPNDVAVTIMKYISATKLMVDSPIFMSIRNPDMVMNGDVWNRAFRTASFKVTGKKYHPHQLRHYRSLEWFNKGIDIIRIQQRLGHSSIATTRLYINPDKKKELENWSKEEY